MDTFPGRARTAPLDLLLCPSTPLKGALGARKRFSLLAPGLKLGFPAPVADRGGSEEASHHFASLLENRSAPHRTNAAGGGLT